MRLPMHPLVRALWRAARDSDDGLGISMEEAAGLCGASLESSAVRARVHQMAQRGYLVPAGPKSARRWVVGLNVPEGENFTVGAPTAPSRSLLAKPFGDLATEAFTAKLGGVPNSIWAVARLVGAQP